MLVCTKRTMSLRIGAEKTAGMGAEEEGWAVSALRTETTGLAAAVVADIVAGS